MLRVGFVRRERHRTHSHRSHEIADHLPAVMAMSFGFRIEPQPVQPPDTQPDQRIGKQGPVCQIDKRLHGTFFLGGRGKKVLVFSM